jgi:hypothetical protein
MRKRPVFIGFAIVSTPNTYIAKVFDAYNQIILCRQDAVMITITTPLDKTLN